MKYLCLDDMSVIDRGGIKLKESEWRKVDNSGTESSLQAERQMPTTIWFGMKKNQT
jgi:ribosome biogenesis protein Tsr3